MKYEFKEGQWFDIRKLTDWQKQWCLDNLEWLSINTKEKFISGRYYITYVAKYEEYEMTFTKLSLTDEYCVSPENEIIFNDFYWGGDEEGKKKKERKLYQFAQKIDWKDYLPIKFFNNESVFDKPQWVTAKHKAPTLTQDKDYKVLGFNGNGNLQKIVVTDDEGKESYYHHSIFHKVTSQDLLPEECKDDEASFDNLVYVEPDIENTVYILDLSKLSKYQLNHAVSYLKDNKLWDSYGENDPEPLCLVFDSDSMLVWQSNNIECFDGYERITFNELFQEVN